MNYLDIFLITPFLFGVYKGFKKGLIIEIASIFALIIAIYYCSEYAPILSGYISLYLNYKFNYINFISYIITFILLLFIINLVGKLITSLINKIYLGPFNKILGAVFGGIKYLILLMILINFFNYFNQYLNLIDSKYLESSVIFNFLLEYSIIIKKYSEDFLTQKNNITII